MCNLPGMQEADREPRYHNSVKWLLTLLSAIVTTGLVIILNGQL
jgi:hypothetical protein